MCSQTKDLCTGDITPIARLSEINEVKPQYENEESTKKKFLNLVKQAQDSDFKKRRQSEFSDTIHIEELPNANPFPKQILDQRSLTNPEESNYQKAVTTSLNADLTEVEGNKAF